MDIRPPRRNYGISSSTALVVIVLLVVLLAINILAATRTDMGGSFYSYWLAGRLLFAQGGDPYGSEVFEQAMLQYPSDANFSGFTLPLYAMILIVPFTFIDNFTAAQVIWMLISEAALIYIGIKLIGALKLSGRFSSGLFMPLILASCYYSAISVLDGDINIIAILFLLIAVGALREQNDEFAGIMLAFATIKYSLTLLPIIWIFIWCFCHRRNSPFLWTMMTLLLLFMIGWLFKGDWIMAFLRGIVYYLRYLNPTNLAIMIGDWQPELGARIGWGISAVMILIMLVEWVVNARGDERAFEWVFSLTIVVAFLSGIPCLGKNMFVLWIPLAYALDKIILRWSGTGPYIGLAIVILINLIPWVTSITGTDSWENPVGFVNLYLIFIVFILLYWNRWWNIDAFVESY